MTVIAYDGKTIAADGLGTRNDHNFKGVWTALHRQIGAKGIDDLMDNHSIEVMRQASDLLAGWLGGRDAAA